MIRYIIWYLGHSPIDPTVCVPPLLFACQLECVKVVVEGGALIRLVCSIFGDQLAQGTDPRGLEVPTLTANGTAAAATATGQPVPAGLVIAVQAVS